MCNVEGQKVSKFNFHVFEEQCFHSAGQWNHSMQSFGNYCHIFCHYCSYPHDAQVKVQALLPNCTRGYSGHCRDFFTFTCFAGYQPYGYILWPFECTHGKISVTLLAFSLKKRSHELRKQSTKLADKGLYSFLAQKIIVRLVTRILIYWKWTIRSLDLDDRFP